MNVRTLALAAGLVAAAASGAAAQERDGRLSVGLRVQAGFPTGDLSRETAIGVGIGAEAAYRLTGPLSVYVGYSGSRYGVESLDDVEIEEGELTLTDRGYDVGVKAQFQPGSSVQPFLRAGAVLHFLRYSGPAIDRLIGTGVIESGEVNEGFGAEFGGGADVRVSTSVDVTVRASYMWMPFTDITGEETSLGVLLPGVGVRIRL